jgi:flagellar hook-associated protein 3
MTRITQQHLISTSLRYSQQHTSNLAKYQLQLSTGLKLHKASDDPAAMERVLALRAQDTRFETDLNSINHVSSVMNQSVSHLQEARSILNQAKQVAINATQPDAQDSLDLHARELDDLLNRLIAVGNESDGGRYLFGGANSDSPPFTEVEGGVDYSGGSERTTVPLGRHRQFNVLYSGAELFQSRDRQPTTITGTTGAKSAGGTDSAIGSDDLVVRHTSTTYAAGSGIAVGTSSAADDTIIGDTGTHRLTIVDTAGDGSAGTISLNGGPPVAFTNGDTNLEIRNGANERVFVDTTAITAGFSGDIDITSNGTLSLDGGATETAIDFSAAQMVTDSETGDVTGIDSSSITLTGTDRVDYPGTFDAFNAISSLRDSLLDETLSQSEINDFATARAADFERHADVILNGIGDQASTLESLEILQTRTEDLQLESRIALGELEGANLAEAAISLQNEQQLLEMTYGSLSRVLDLSLFDFLN